MPFVTGRGDIDTMYAMSRCISTWTFCNKPISQLTMDPTHYYSPDTIQKEIRAMPLPFKFTLAQTIAEEQDRKQRFPFVT